MVFDGRWKFCYYSTGEYELYDLESEDNETVNLAGRGGECPEVEARLMGSLLRHQLANISASPLPAFQRVTQSLNRTALLTLDMDIQYWEQTWRQRVQGMET